MKQLTTRIVLLAGLAAATGGTALGQGTPPANGSTTAAPTPVARTPVVRTTGIPQRDTLIQMMRPVSNVDFSDQRLEDVMKFITTLTGADVEVMWADGTTTTGLDKDAQVTLKLPRGTAMQLMEKVMEKGQTDSGTGGNTWQMTESGTIQVGPKERLNAYRRVVVYSITDLIQDIPDYPDAPEFDLQSVLQNTGQGGGSSQSPFRQGNDQQRDRRTFEQRADDLKKILTSLVEPEQWIDNGGQAASIQYFQGNFIVNAPDYVHRGLDGYPYWPASATRITNTGGRRYVSLGVDTAISKIRGFENQLITGVASGVPSGGGGGSGRPPIGPGPGGGGDKPKKK